MEIAEVDVRDEGALRTWFAARDTAVREGRPDALVETYDALRAAVVHPGDYHRRVLLAATDGGRVVGTAEVALSLQDNTHVAEVDVAVLPDVRRRGVGRLLHGAATRRRRREGRTSASGEVHVPSGSDAAGLAFARALGYRTVHEEDHLVLTLPADPDPGPLAEGYEVLGWRGACPDELLAAYAGLRTRMNQDVPVGERDVEAVEVSPERVRAGEERLGRAYDLLVAAARHRADGLLVGYSLVLVPQGTPDALQDDTLVLAEHRGHRLGLALKAATLSALREHHPGLASIHTWTDPHNDPMQATNRRFGYQVVERMHEVEHHDLHQDPDQ